MDIKEQIKSLLNQAQVYHSQGLLDEAQKLYIKAGRIFKKNEKELKDTDLFSTIKKKLQILKGDIAKVENAPQTPEVSRDIQDVIKKHFAFGKGGNKSGLEGAIALAKFGQFSRALEEFTQLISIDSVRLDAAKNIFRCHMALDSLDKAVDQFTEWNSGELFLAEQMVKLRIFLQDMLNKKGVDRNLPQIKEKVSVQQADTVRSEAADITLSGRIEDEDILDISSIGITLEDGPQKGQTIEFDVSFQSGNVISLLIANTEKDLIENFDTGIMLNDVQYYSPIAMFNGKGIVASKTKIESGPKKGDYSLDIKIKTV